MLAQGSDGEVEEEEELEEDVGEAEIVEESDLEAIPTTPAGVVLGERLTSSPPSSLGEVIRRIDPSSDSASTSSSTIPPASRRTGRSRNGRQRSNRS